MVSLKLFAYSAVLAVIVVLAGCDAGSQGTAQDEENLERLSREGMSAPSNQGNMQRPGEPAAPGTGQSMNPPPADYTGN